MAQTLEEFLVSLKFNVDQSSQQRFFDTVKRAAGSISGVAAEVVGLTTAITAFADKMAKVGDEMYWMSQRLNSSIDSLQSTSRAMSTLGMTTGEAAANMERFGGFVRSYGPAANSLLRQLGVTTLDTAKAMEQAAQTLYARGLRPDMVGTTAYAMQLQYANLIGLSEQFVRTIPLLAQRRAAMEDVANKIWGGRGQAVAGQERFGAQSNQMILQFARLESMFVNIAEKMALNIFPAVSRFIDQMIAYGPRLVEIFDGLAKGLGLFVDFVAKGVQFLRELPRSIEVMAGVFLTLPTALRLLMSPLGMIIAGFTALFILMDDYKHWEEDQKTGRKDKTSLYDWDQGIFGLLRSVGKELGQFSENDDWTIAILGGIGAIAARFLLLGKNAGVAAGAINALSRNPWFWAIYIASTIGGMGFDYARRHGVPIITDPEGGSRPGIPDQTSIPPTNAPPPSKVPNDQLITGKTLWERLWRFFQHGSLVPEQHSDAADAIARGMAGARRRMGYQTASAGNDWTVPSGFADDEDSALYKLLRDKFDLSLERLEYIGATLSDMALTMGAGDEARGGTGSYGSAFMGTPATSQEQVEYAKDLSERLGIPLEAASGIVSNLMAESGLDPRATSSTGAHGAAQWIRSRWGPLAAWARQHGFDPETKEGQKEMLIHDIETNFSGLLNEFRRGGGDPTHFARRFSYEFEAGHYAPLLTPQFYGSHARWADPINQRARQGNTYNTTITVTAPSPASAAHQTADALHRVFQEHHRLSETAFL